MRRECISSRNCLPRTNSGGVCCAVRGSPDFIEVARIEVARSEESDPGHIRYRRSQSTIAIVRQPMNFNSRYSNKLQLVRSAGSLIPCFSVFGPVSAMRQSGKEG